jgi:ethanolamine utilization protein EutN
VCVDAVGAGTGQVVITVMGSSARSAPEMGSVPTDAVVVGILDALTTDGQSMDLSTVNDAA